MQNRIKGLRKNLGLTQVELGKKLELPAPLSINAKLGSL